MIPWAPSIEYGHNPHTNHLSLIIFMFVKLPIKKPTITKKNINEKIKGPKCKLKFF